jgi:general stress protein 26
MKYAGGCGRVQPKYRRSGLDLYMNGNKHQKKIKNEKQNYQLNVFFQYLKQYLILFVIFLEWIQDIQDLIG